MGGYAFALAESFCAIAYLVLRKRSKRKAMEQAEGWATALARWTFIGIFVVVVFTVAPFRQYQAAAGARWSPQIEPTVQVQALILAEQLLEISEKWRHHHAGPVPNVAYHEDFEVPGFRRRVEDMRAKLAYHGQRSEKLDAITRNILRDPTDAQVVADMAAEFKKLAERLWK